MTEDVVLIDPWWDLRGGEPREATQRAAILDQLALEVAPTHALYGHPIEVIGRSTARDDVILRLDDGRWALVHLTYGGPQTPPWPHTRFFRGTRDLERHLDDAE